LLHLTKYSRRWAYDSPIFKAPISLPDFIAVSLGFELYLTKENIASYIDGVYELTETLLITRLLPHFSRFIDVGANVGYFTCLAAKYGKEVIAFEPSSATYSQLLKGIEKNGFNVTAHNKAVGEVAGSQDFFICDDPGRSSLVGPWDNKEKVEVVTLDQFASPNTLIKIDVENYEEPVLRGMQKWLQSPDRPIILIESWPPYNKAVIPTLQQYYKIYTINPKPKHGAMPLLPIGSKGFNYLALPADYDIFKPIDMRLFTATDKLENLLAFALNWK